MEDRAESRRVWWWLLAIAASGVAMTQLWLDTYQQDGGNHFLGARWSWKYARPWVDVWERPLFIWVYNLPAQLGWNAARLFTTLLCTVTAWQTWRLARDLGLRRAWLAVPLLWLQPVFFQLSADVMTEPLHGLVLVCALRLHVRGRVKAGMLVASLLILARPEGFFCGVLWGIWALLDRRVAPKPLQRLGWTLLLASGVGLWMIVSWLVMGDPIWFIRHWPANWRNGAYGTVHFLDYPIALREIVGVLFIPALIAGLWIARTAEAGRTGLRCVAGMWLCIFVVHSVMGTWGLMGATAYPRFMVSVAPAGAIILLAGWNMLARWNPFGPWPRYAAFALSFAVNLLYLDGWPYTRDARGIADTWKWWETQQRPVTRLIWSQAYACIVADRDFLERQLMNGDRQANVAMLQTSGSGTLAIWENETGPAWFEISEPDFLAAGFQRLRSQDYTLGGAIVGQWTWWRFAPRKVTFHVFYKP